MKIIINKIFSFIAFLYFFGFYLISENDLFLMFSLVSLVSYLSIDYFLKLYEVKKNLEHILNYLFFYLDEESQMKIFSRNKYYQMRDIINIWFFIDSYFKAKFKRTYFSNNWESKITKSNEKLIMLYIKKHKHEIEKPEVLIENKQKFLNKLINNLNKEKDIHKMFSDLESCLKEDKDFLTELNLFSKEDQNNPNQFNSFVLLINPKK